MMMRTAPSLYAQRTKCVLERALQPSSGWVFITVNCSSRRRDEKVNVGALTLCLLRSIVCLIIIMILLAFSST